LDLGHVEKNLIGEVGLTANEAKVFMYVTLNGKMPVDKISKGTGIDKDESLATAKRLVSLGGLIEFSALEFEAMHPRFTAVNMYRKKCAQQNIPFKKNLTVDNIGVALEMYYERARTK
jgi:hypothetical protein